MDLRPLKFDILTPYAADLGVSFVFTLNSVAYDVGVASVVLYKKGTQTVATGGVITVTQPQTGTVNLSATTATLTALAQNGPLSYALFGLKAGVTTELLSGDFQLADPTTTGTPTAGTQAFTVPLGGNTVSVAVTVAANSAANITVTDANSVLGGATEVNTALQNLGRSTARWASNGRKSGVFAVLGTSVSNRNQSTHYGLSNNWHGYLSTLTNHRLSRAYAETLGGATLATLRDTYLPVILASTSRLFPGSCVVEGGENDVLAQSTGFSALQDIVTSLTNAGIRPVLTKLPPRSDGSQNAVLSWNARVAEYAKRNGFPVFDMYTPILDTSTGGALAAYQLDTVHPNEKGHFQIAQAATNDVAFMSQWGDARPQPQTSVGDTANLVTSNAGLFLVDTNADGVADNWSQFSAANGTASRVTHDGLTWQRLTKSAAQAGQTGLQYTISSGFTAGDLVEVSLYVVTSAIDVTWGFSLECRSAVPATIPSTKPDIWPFNDSGTSGGGTFNAVAAGYICRGYYTVQPSTATLRLNLTYTGAPAAGGYIEIAAVTVRNLTTLGLA